MLEHLVRLAARRTVAHEWEQLRTRIQYQCEMLSAMPQVAPPLIAQKLLVSGEDRRHGWHPGFDVRAIARALWRRLTSNRREGASTIEQQVVRVFTGRFERSMMRKIREILLASLVAEAFPKSSLPAVYLRIGYYGWKMNGFEQACRRLRLSPGSMTLSDAASLVARLKYPEPHVAPRSRIDQIRCRREYLTRLYFQHLEDETYDHLNPSRAGKTVRSGGSAIPTPRAVPAA